MNKDQLIIKAKELGIQDAENLTVAELKTAIGVAEQRLALINEATELGIENASDVESEQLQYLILATESTNLKLKNEELEGAIKVLQNKTNLFAHSLSIENVGDLSVKELEAVVVEKLSRALGSAEQTNVVDENAGKTDNTFKAANGMIYGFSENAPAKFRYTGVVKTQEEWIKDSDTLELMLAGGLDFLKVISKKE